MKKFIFLIGVMLATGILAPASYAQFSVGLSGTYTRYFGDKYKFPLTTVDKFPFLVGGKLRFAYGFMDRNSINLNIGYNMGTKEVDLNYLGNTMKPSSIEAELNYHRYFVGDYQGYAPVNVYVLAGMSLVRLKLDYTVPDTTATNSAGEPKFFRDESTMVVHANIGLGAEVRVTDSFFLFLEAKTGIHTNAYVNNTTIWETNLMYFGQANLGFRIPIRPGRRPST